MDSSRGSARPLVFAVFALAVLGALGFVMFGGEGGGDDDRYEARAIGASELEVAAPAVFETDESGRHDEERSEAIAEAASEPEPDPNAIPADATGLTGRVIGRDGKPAADVEVTVWRTVGKKQLAKYGLTAEPGKDTARYLKTARTDDTGRFTIVELIADVAYGLRARGAEGLLGRKDGIEVIEKHLFDLGDVPLKRGAIVSGTVRNEGGAPIAAAEVHFDWGASDKPCIADAQGRYRSDVLMPGKRQVRVKAKGYALRETIQRELIEGDLIDDLDLELVKAEPIRGRIVDAAGIGVANAYVNCYREQDEMSFFGWINDDVRSGPGGDFVFDSLPAGKYQVSCSLVGYRGSSQEGVVAGGDPIELKLTRVSSIEGRVFDAATNAPVKADSVRLLHIPPNAKGNPSFRPYWRGAEIDVEEVGKYRVTLNEGGQFKVVVTADGYRPAESSPFQLTENAQMTGIDVRLEKGQELELVVVDKATRSPVPGAIVRVFEGVGTTNAGAPMMQGMPFVGGGMNIGPGGSRGAGVGRAISDAEGIARVKSMFAGKFHARAEHAGYAPGKLDPIEIADGAAATRLEFELGLGGAIEGVVTDDKKKPEPAMTVYAIGKEHRAEGVTDADGKYSIPRLPPGRYRIEDELANQNARWFGGGWDGGDGRSEEEKFPLVVEDGRATRHDVTVTRIPPGSIVGSLLFNGAPAQNVMVMVMRKNPANEEWDWQTQNQAKTDAQGRFKFRSLKPGLYGVSAGPNWERQYALGTADVSPAQESFVVFDVPLGSLRGRIVDQDGRPVADAWIEVVRRNAEQEFNPWGGGRSIRSDAAGEFVVEHLQAGQYSLNVSKRGYRPAASDPIAVAPRREAGPIEVKLTLGGWIELRLAGVERLGQNARLRANLAGAAGEDRQSFSLWTETPGTYWIDAAEIPKGTLTILARPAGQSSNIEVASSPYAVEPGKNLVLNLQIP